MSRTSRKESQQMGFGTVQPLALPQYLSDLRERGIITATELFLDIGAGCGNVLEDVSSLISVWGVEMNTSFLPQTPSKWESSIVWSKLEETTDARLERTTIAYMYDLCLKRLSRRSKSLSEDPHWSIQDILLNSDRMPSLRYFLSTYEEKSMYSGHGNCWKLVEEKKLPCSTNSYTFYLYERIALDDSRVSKRSCEYPLREQINSANMGPNFIKKRKIDSSENVEVNLVDVNEIKCIL